MTRVQPPEGSEPEGAGFGKPWVPQASVTFLAFGAYVRSIVRTEPPPARGLVGMDVPGKWNHGAKDTLSLIVRPEVAREWAAPYR
jgi:hypothetical protein